MKSKRSGFATLPEKKLQKDASTKFSKDLPICFLDFNLRRGPKKRKEIANNLIAYKKKLMHSYIDVPHNDRNFV